MGKFGKLARLILEEETEDNAWTKKEKKRRRESEHSRSRRFNHIRPACVL